MGTRLKAWRDARNITQAELSRRSGVPIGTLRNWEQDRRVPLLDTAARVAQVLDVSLDELAGLRSSALPATAAEPAEPAPPPEPAPEQAKPARRPRKRKDG